MSGPVSVEAETTDASGTGAASPASPRSDARPGWPLVAGLIGGVVLLVVGTNLLVAAHSRPPSAPPASVGTAFDRPVPMSVLALPLVDQAGRATTLGALRGKVVLVAPFLTSCQEVCPITTGVLLQVQGALSAAGLTDKVSVVEITQDPGRDTPARLAAYAHLAGTGWPLLTGTPRSLDTLWRFFGFYHRVVPEASPPGIDWQTGKPYTYDVDHADGFFLVDAEGHERFSTAAMPETASLPPALTGLLDAEGRTNLSAPRAGSWSAADALGALGWLEGRTIALPG